MNRMLRILCGAACAFVFCFLAIGYAAIQDELLVTGSVSVDGYTWKYDFDYADTDGYTIDSIGTLIIEDIYYDSTAKKFYRVGGIAANGFTNELFASADSVESVVISENVSIIGENAFIGCKNLKSYKVDSKNENYTSPDGVLYNKGITQLIHYPQNRDATVFNVPSTVTEVKANAFNDNTKLHAICTVTELYNADAWKSQNALVIYNQTGVTLSDVTNSSGTYTITYPSGYAYSNAAVTDRDDTTVYPSISSKKNTVSSSDYSTDRWIQLRAAKIYAFATLDTKGHLNIYNRLNSVNSVFVPDDLDANLKIYNVQYIPTGSSNPEGATAWTEMQNGATSPVKSLSFVDKYAITCGEFFFKYFSFCETMDLSKLDTSAVTNMHNMFYECKKVKNWI